MNMKKEGVIMLLLVAVLALLPKTLLAADGTISWYDRQTGVGFIKPKDASASVFFHYSVIVMPVDTRHLVPGRTVEYAAQGRTATWVKVK